MTEDGGTADAIDDEVNLDTDDEEAFLVMLDDMAPTEFEVSEVFAAVDKFRRKS